MAESKTDKNNFEIHMKPCEKNRKQVFVRRLGKLAMTLFPVFFEPGDFLF
jgi:hypothetical protein